jgi:hypothetical protein
MACYKCHTEVAGYVENTHAKRRFCSAKCQSRYYEIGGAVEGKVLPHIPYPRHSLLIVKQYREHKIFSYGTAFVRDLMVQEGLPTDEFDLLLVRLAAIRRAMLSEYIYRIEKTSSTAMKVYQIHILPKNQTVNTKCMNSSSLLGFRLLYTNN